MDVKQAAESMEIRRLCLGEYGTNCYLMLDKMTGKCAVIDPADDGPEIEKALKSMQAVPAAILLTHGHYDHILAVPYLQEHFSELPVYCHALDCPAALAEVDMGVTYPTVSAFKNLIHYSENSWVNIGEITVKVMHTPGHTPGSVTLLAEDVLFTGDTLFRGDIGRSDFAGGNQEMLMESLRRIAALPGDFRVLPGHDDVSTLDYERRMNPYLKHRNQHE